MHVTPEPADDKTDDASEGPEGGGIDDPVEGSSSEPAAVGQTVTKTRRRGRTIGAWVALVVACVLAITSVVAVYARNQLLDTDTFVATMAPLASDPAVQAAVATRVSDRLVAQTDVEQRIKNALPPRADFLANPITSTVHSATYAITLKVVQSSRFQQLWELALRKAHTQVVNLLTGSSQGALSASNGQVTVDLAQVEAQAKQQLAANGLTVFNKVPTYTGAPFVLFHSAQLVRLQRLTKLLNQLVVLLPILALLLFALSVVLARDRRKGLVHVAAGLAVSMAILLVGANVGRNQYLNSLIAGQSRPATAAVIDTVDAMLLDTVRTVLIVAAVVAIVAFALGTAPVRRLLADRTAPRWLISGRVHDTVAAHRRAFQWGVLVLGLVVLVVWNQPTAKAAVIGVLITLLVVILVGLYGRSRPAVDTGLPPGAPSS